VLQALEGLQEVEFPDLNTISTWRW